MTNIQLVLLGILGNQSMHGYEIKQIIEDHMGDWTDIKFGSIYFALSRLTDKGTVEVAGKTRTGNRPSRTVYRITEKGREEYLRLLRELWSDDSRTLYSVDIGVFFMKSLPKAEMARHVDERLNKTREKLAYLQLHKTEHENDPHIPPQAMVIMNHSIFHMQAEYAWLKDMKEKLDTLY